MILFVPAAAAGFASSTKFRAPDQPGLMAPANRAFRRSGGQPVGCVFADATPGRTDRNGLKPVAEAPGRRDAARLDVAEGLRVVKG